MKKDMKSMLSRGFTTYLSIPLYRHNLSPALGAVCEINITHSNSHLDYYYYKGRTQIFDINTQTSPISSFRLKEGFV